MSDSADRAPADPAHVVSVVLVDDDPLVRSALRLILGGSDSIRVVGEGMDGASGRDAILRLRPDVALMDLSMPGLDGIGTTQAVVAAGSATRVLVLTAFDTDSHVLGALEAGATGFLLKDASPREIVEAVMAAAQGESRFSAAVLDRLVATALEGTRSRRARPREVTDREWEVARLVSTGLTNQEIADHLHVGIATVKTHVSQVLLKVGATNRVQLALAVLAVEGAATNAPGGDIN